MDKAEPSSRIGGTDHRFLWSVGHRKRLGVDRRQKAIVCPTYAAPTHPDRSGDPRTATGLARSASRRGPEADTPQTPPQSPHRSATPSATTATAPAPGPAGWRAGS